MEDAPSQEAFYKVSTDLFDASFTNRGGELVSLKLKKHADGKEAVDMFLPRNGSVSGFSVALGDAGSAPINSLYECLDGTRGRHRILPIIPCEGCRREPGPVCAEEAV